MIVSHDRYFMDKVADTMFVLENDGSVSGFVGKCSEYIDYREEKRAAEKEEMKAQIAASKAAEAAVSTPGAQAASSGNTAPEKKRKLSFKEQKEFEELEKNIADWEEKKGQLEVAMGDSDYAKAQAAGKEYSQLEEKLTTAYERWEVLAELA